jgi:hypothetical protein
MGPPRGEDAPLLDVAHFTVTIGEVEVGFSSISSLTSETDPTDPIGSRYRTVVLRRALTDSKDLYLWRQRVAEGHRDVRSVTIRQYDASGGRPVNAWLLVNAWPCRWSGPAFDAVEGGVAMEEIELACERLVWLKDAEREEEGDGGIA